jgi:hypothetical protein
MPCPCFDKLIMTIGIVTLSLPKGAKLLLRPCFDKLSIDMWLVRTTLVTLSLSKGAG